MGSDNATNGNNMKGRVLNKSQGRIPLDAIYIGRGSKWGNPYHIGKDGSREEVIEKYRSYLIHMVDRGVVTIEELADMQGFDLVCFCKPLSCHGDVLLEAIEAAYQLVYG